MKVLDLLCSNEHRFEGWFASEDDFVAQVESGLLACPMCADTAVSRLPSAPRLNVSKQRAVVAQAAQDGPARSRAQIESQMLRAVRHMMATTEDVGERFPEEARRIHYGEVEERGIRGRATREEALALAEEGIEVMAVPVPVAVKGATH